MNKYSIEFYNKVAGRKKLSEVFLGYQSYLWKSSEVSYSADCTEAMPLNMFDKVICGILELDGAVSAERIGEILGLNVISNEDNHQYADTAEMELLMDSLRSLEEFGMIQQDPETGKFTLSVQGSEYAGTGKKFKTTSNSGFNVFYDITSGNHAKAKEVFQNLPNITRPGFFSSAAMRDEYQDETALKSFIHEQLPDIYDPEKGNSFTNIAVDGIKEKMVKVYFAVLYDLQEKSYRLIGFLNSDEDTYVENDFFTDAVNGNQHLLDTIVSMFVEHQQVNTEAVSELQEEFVQAACDAQGQYDFNKYNNEDPQPVADAFSNERSLFEHECFWNSILDFIPENISKVFFNFDELNAPMLINLQKLAISRPDLYMFILYRTTDQSFNDYDGKTFFFKATGTASNVFCCTEKAVFDYVPFIIEGHNDRSVTMVHRNVEPTINLMKLEGNFAQAFVPKLFEDTMAFLDGEFEGKKGELESIMNCDASLMVFKDWADEGKLQQVSSRKLEVYNEAKRKNEDKLLDVFSKITGECDVESIQKIELIGIWKNKIDKLAANADATYIRFNEAVSAFMSGLREREQFIKDELMAKTFIIDTNSLLNSPDIVNKIGRKDRIVIPLMVYEELEKLKSKLAGQEEGENARIARKNIDVLRKKGKRLSIEKGKFALLPAELQLNKTNPDNLILAVAIAHADANPFLVTSDEGLQSKAAVEGISSITAEDLKSKIETEAAPKIDVIENNDGVQEGTGTASYLQVYYDLKKDGKPVTAQKYEKALKRAGIDYKDSGYRTFEEYCNSLPEFRVKIASNGFTYVNLK